MKQVHPSSIWNRFLERGTNVCDIDPLGSMFLRSTKFKINQMKLNILVSKQCDQATDGFSSCIDNNLKKNLAEFSDFNTNEIRLGYV